MLEHETETLGPLVIQCQHIFSVHFYQVNIFHCHQAILMKIWHLMKPPSFPTTYCFHYFSFIFIRMQHATQIKMLSLSRDS